MTIAATLDILNTGWIVWTEPYDRISSLAKWQCWQKISHQIGFVCSVNKGLAPNVQFISFISVTPKFVKEKRCVLLFYLFIHLIVWLFSDKQRQADKFSAKGHYTIQSDRRFTSLEKYFTSLKNSRW